MTESIATAVTIALLWFATLAVVSAIYSCLSAPVLRRIAAWRARCRRSQQQRAETERELERIDRDAAESIQRIQAVFVHAHHLLRQEARAGAAAVTDPNRLHTTDIGHRFFNDPGGEAL